MIKMNKKEQTTNPFALLASKSFYKDIDENFIDTLKALIFFNSHEDSKEIERLINEKVTMHYSEKMNIANESKELSVLPSNIKIKKEYSNSFYSKVDNYSITEEKSLTEVLMDKLAQNFRRVYSSQRKGRNRNKYDKTTGTLESLKQQQNYIYEALEIVSPYVSFREEKRVFTRLFMGNLKYYSNVTAFYYMAFHEHLFEENEKKHLNLLNKMFDMKDLDPNILYDLSQISYKNNKEDFLHNLIKDFPKEILENNSDYFTQKRLYSGRFSLDLFLYYAKNDIDLADDLKLKLFMKVIHSKSFLFKYPNSSIKEFADNIRSYLPNMDFTKEMEKLIIPRNIGKDTVVDLALELVNKLEDPKLFMLGFVEEITSNQRYKLFSKYDLNNENFIMKVVKEISEINIPSVRLDTMNKFVNHISDSITPKVISNILAQDFSYMKIMKPIYMNMKLKMQFNKEDAQKGVINTKSRLKI